jgi:hypothetical protein
MNDIQYFRTYVVVDEDQPNIPENYQLRVVSAVQHDAALAREAALREELATIYSDRDAEKKMKAKARDQRDVQTIRACELQQRLTVAEQRVTKLTGILRDVSEYVRHPDYDWYPCDRDAVSDALKPAAEPEHICKGCGSKGWTANCAQCVPY